MTVDNLALPQPTPALQPTVDGNVPPQALQPPPALQPQVDGSVEMAFPAPLLRVIARLGRGEQQATAMEHEHISSEQWMMWQRTPAYCHVVAHANTLGKQGPLLARQYYETTALGVATQVVDDALTSEHPRDRTSAARLASEAAGLVGPRGAVTVTLQQQTVTLLKSLSAAAQAQDTGTGTGT